MSHDRPLEIIGLDVRLRVVLKGGPSVGIKARPTDCFPSKEFLGAYGMSTGRCRKVGVNVEVLKSEKIKISSN